MTLTEALDISKPCVISCVGAGGKTSLLLSLAAALQAQETPYLLTFTTRMCYGQIEQITPVMVDDYEQGIAQVRRQLSETKSAVWFSRQEGEKIIGIPPVWIDQLRILEPALYILVEADGARGKLLKAPARYEPVVPRCSQVTVGVLNTDAIGQPMSAAIIHRVELAACIIDKAVGQLIEASDIARLAGHQQGIFRNCAGKKLLVLTGNRQGSSTASEIVRYISRNNAAQIEKCIVVQRFAREIKPVQVYYL